MEICSKNNYAYIQYFEYKNEINHINFFTKRSLRKVENYEIGCPKAIHYKRKLSIGIMIDLNDITNMNS